MYHCGRGDTFSAFRAADFAWYTHLDFASANIEVHSLKLKYFDALLDPFGKVYRYICIDIRVVEVYFLFLAIAIVRWWRPLKLGAFRYANARGLCNF